MPLSKLALTKLQRLAGTPGKKGPWCPRPATWDKDKHLQELLAAGLCERTPNNRGTLIPAGRKIAAEVAAWQEPRSPHLSAISDEDRQRWIEEALSALADADAGNCGTLTFATSDDRTPPVTYRIVPHALRTWLVRLGYRPQFTADTVAASAESVSAATLSHEDEEPVGEGATDPPAEAAAPVYCACGHDRSEHQTPGAECIGICHCLTFRPPQPRGCQCPDCRRPHPAKCSDCDQDGPCPRCALALMSVAPAEPIGSPCYIYTPSTGAFHPASSDVMAVDQPRKEAMCSAGPVDPGGNSPLTSPIAAGVESSGQSVEPDDGSGAANPARPEDEPLRAVVCANGHEFLVPPPTDEIQTFCPTCFDVVVVRHIKRRAGLCDQCQQPPPGRTRRSKCKACGKMLCLDCRRNEHWSHECMGHGAASSGAEVAPPAAPLTPPSASTEGCATGAGASGRPEPAKATPTMDRGSQPPPTATDEETDDPPRATDHGSDGSVHQDHGRATGRPEAGPADDHRGAGVHGARPEDAGLERGAGGARCSGAVGEAECVIPSCEPDGQCSTCAEIYRDYWLPAAADGPPGPPHLTADPGGSGGEMSPAAQPVGETPGAATDPPPEASVSSSAGGVAPAPQILRDYQAATVADALAFVAECEEQRP